MIGESMMGESIGRMEDLPLLTGRARFVDDLSRPGMLHLGVVRSPHAHARITGMSTAPAAALPGIVAAFGARELPELARPIPPYKAKQKFRAYQQPVLARTVVRYVGEPVAVVVAEDPRFLGAALEVIAVDYEPLPAVSSTEAALRTGAPRVHEHWPDNVAYIGRASIHFTGRPSRRASAAARMSSPCTWPFAPNEPPTSGERTRTSSSASPSTCAMTSRR